MKKIISGVFFVMLSGANAQAEGNGKFDKFMPYNKASDLSVAYDDLDAFLDESIYEVGPSRREKGDRNARFTGTNLRTRVNRLTVLEGNRFYFQNFDNEEYTEILYSLQQSLEQLPQVAPLEELDKNDQLAYWLNLYNFTILKEMAEEWPALDMRGFTEDDEDTLLNRHVVTIDGVDMSLNDIQFNILKEKYNAHPLIIYGLFQGVIGSPSIQDDAFTGDRVWRQLERIAKDFINSNRGTYYDGRLSDFYKRNMAFFDNDKEKLKSHILDYLEGELHDEIASIDADDLELDIHDHSLVGIGGARKFGAGLSSNRAAFIDAAKVEQRGVAGTTPNFMAEGLIQRATNLNIRFSPDEIAILQELNTGNKISKGKVTVKDLSEEEANSKQSQKKEQ